jgi:transcriptional regulator with XRE-family HTH domain
MAADFDPGTGLGPRLRLVREGRALSVRELARRVGCSASLVSQVERGLSVPSVGVLYSLASELDCSLDYLLFGIQGGRPPSAILPPGAGEAPEATAGADAPRSDGVVQRGCDRRIIDLASGVRWERLTPGADDRVDFLEVIYSPGGHSTDERRPLRHEGREYGLIVSGTLRASVGFETYELKAGDSIAFDSSTPHEYWNTTDDHVRAVWVVMHPAPGLP